jgi:hypothetical protein
MRNGQNKRMRGRNRNHKSHHSGGGGGGGGGHHHNPLTRVYESNGPEVKIRGTAHHIAEKYLQLARDAQGSGDPVTAENHFQHAEHYLRMIAAAQEQFRAQNPYYQAPPAPGEIRDEAFDGEDGDDGQPGQSQPGQGQPAQGQPPQAQQNFGGQQNNPQGYNNGQQPPYPPREQPQPYGGQQPNSNYQGRPQQQPQQHQPYNPPQQYQPQPAQPSGAEGNDVERLPSFITGGQPQPSVPNTAPNGYDNNQGGDRFPRHRRRRHRGPGGPRPDLPQDFRGDEGPEPGNN